MISKRFVHLLVAMVALMLVSGAATAFAAEEAPGTDQTRPDDSAPDPPNPSLGDA
jgi:hypothetical protein